MASVDFLCPDCLQTLTPTDNESLSATSTASPVNGKVVETHDSHSPMAAIKLTKSSKESHVLTIHTLEDKMDGNQLGHCKAGLDEQFDENPNHDQDIASKESTEMTESVTQPVFSEDDLDVSADVNGDLSDSTDILDVDQLNSTASTADINTKLDDDSKNSNVFRKLNVMVPDNPMQFDPLNENSSSILTFFGEDDNSHLSWDSSVAISDSEASRDAVDSKLTPEPSQKEPCSFASQIPTSTDGLSSQVQVANDMPEMKAAVENHQLVSDILHVSKQKESTVQSRRTQTEQLPGMQTGKVVEKRKHIRMKNVTPKCSEPVATVLTVTASVEKEVPPQKEVSSLKDVSPQKEVPSLKEIQKDISKNVANVSEAVEVAQDRMSTVTVLVSAKDSFFIEQDICRTCGSIGTNSDRHFLSCSQCGHCYHPYCVNIKVSKVLLKHGWRCLDCTVCEGCGSNTDEANLLLCEDCDVSYHTYCLNPPLKQVPDGAWRCPLCVYCRTCGATDSGTRCQWENNYTECGPCASHMQCPMCKSRYQDGQLLLQCEECERWSHAACDSFMREADVEAVASSGYQCLFCRPHTKHMNNPQPRELYVSLRESAIKLYAAARQRLNEQDTQERKEIEPQKEKEMAVVCKKLEQTLMKCAVKRRTDPNEKQSGTNSLGILERLHRIQTQLKGISDAVLAEKSVPDMSSQTVNSMTWTIPPSQKWKGEELNAMVRERSASPHNNEINIKTDTRHRRHSADSYNITTETAVPIWQPLLTEMTDKAQTLPMFLSMYSQLQTTLQMVNNQDGVMDDSLQKQTSALKNLYECLSQQSQSIESNSYFLIPREDEHLFKFAAKALENLMTPSQSEQTTPCAPANTESTSTPSQAKQRKPKKKSDKRKETSDSTPNGSQPGTPLKPSIPSELTIRPSRGPKNKLGESTPGPSYEKWQEVEDRGELATLAAILYANIEKPELKETVKDGWDRMRIVNRLWKKANAEVREKYVYRARQNRTKLLADLQRASYEEGNVDVSQTESLNKYFGQARKDKKKRTLMLKDIVDNAMSSTVTGSVSATTALPFSTVTATVSQVSQSHTPLSSSVLSPVSHAFLQSPFAEGVPRPMLVSQLPSDQLTTLQLAVLQNQQYPFLRPVVDPRLIGHNPLLVSTVHNIHGRTPLPVQPGLSSPHALVGNVNAALASMNTNLPHSALQTSDQLRFMAHLQQLAHNSPSFQPSNSAIGTTTAAEVSRNELTAETRNDSPNCPSSVPMVDLDKWREVHMPPTFTTASIHGHMHRSVVPTLSPQQMPLAPQYPWVPPWVLSSGSQILQERTKKGHSNRRLKTKGQKKNIENKDVWLLFRPTVSDSEANTAAEKVSRVVATSLPSTETENSKCAQDDKQLDQPVRTTASKSESQTAVVQGDNAVEEPKVKKRRTSTSKHVIERTAERLVVAPPEVMACLPSVQKNEVLIQMVTSPSYVSNPSSETGSSSTVQSKAISLPHAGDRALPLPAPRPPAIQPARPLSFPNIVPRRPILPQHQLQPRMFATPPPFGQYPPPRQLSVDQQDDHQQAGIEIKQTVRNKRHPSKEIRPTMAAENNPIPLTNYLYPLPLQQPTLMNKNPMQVLSNCYDIHPVLRGKYGKGQLPNGEDFYNSSAFHSLKVSHLMRQPTPTTSSTIPFPPIGPLGPASLGSVTDLLALAPGSYPFIQSKSAQAAAPQTPAAVKRVSLPSAASVSESVSKVIKPIGESTVPQPALPSPLTPTQTKLAEALRNHLLWNQIKPSHESSLMKTFVNARSQETAKSDANPSTNLLPVSTTELLSSGNSQSRMMIQGGEHQIVNVKEKLHNKIVSNQQPKEMAAEPVCSDLAADSMDSQSGSSNVAITMDLRQAGMPCNQQTSNINRQPERMETDNQSVTTCLSVGVHDWARRVPRPSVSNNQMFPVRTCETVSVTYSEAERSRLSSGYRNTNVGVSSSYVSNGIYSSTVFPLSNQLGTLTLQSASVASSSCQQSVASQSGLEQTMRKRMRPNDSELSSSSVHGLQSVENESANIIGNTSESVPQSCSTGENAEITKQNAKRRKTIQWKRWRSFMADVANARKSNSMQTTDSTDMESLWDEWKFVLPSSDLTDTRECALCGACGDGDRHTTSRLLMLGINKWVHLNCCLWSPEVYETVGGALRNAQVAVKRAKEKTCAVCEKRGASLYCTQRNCGKSYHFQCAIDANCYLYKDKTVFCYSHKNQWSDDQLMKHFDVERHVFTERNEKEELERVVCERIGCVFRIGSVVYHSIGQLSTKMQKFYTENCVYPIGYEATRFYWSMNNAYQRCRYHCLIRDIGGEPQFVITVQEAGYPDNVITSDTATGAWMKVLEATKAIREKTSVLKLFPEYITGEYLFGLTEPAVVQIIESMPGVDQLPGYRFSYPHRATLPLPLPFNPSGSARTEASLWHAVRGRRGARLLRSAAGQSQKIPKSGGDSSNQDQVSVSLASGSNPSKGSGTTYLKQFVKAQEYRRLKQEWPNNVQLGRSPIQGLGLFAKRDMEKYTMVIEYKGLVIRNEVANKREKIYEDQRRGCYMFRIDSEQVIDATLHGGLARYINHACEPNCVAEVVEFEKEKKIIIISNRFIKKGEELTYDYKFEFEAQSSKIPCNCGALSCRKWMN
jgi:hypothetical protein